MAKARRSSSPPPRPERGSPIPPRTPMLVHCQACGHEWSPAFTPIDLSVLVRVMQRISKTCPACRKGPVLMGGRIYATPAGDYLAWIDNGDTGISSETIWSVCSGLPLPRIGAPPCDPADFGRCHRLLQVMPAWRPRLTAVADRFPAWVALVEVWDELTALYERDAPSGRCDALYARLQALGKETP